MASHVVRHRSNIFGDPIVTQTSCYKKKVAGTRHKSTSASHAGEKSVQYFNKPTVAGTPQRQCFALF